MALTIPCSTTKIVSVDDYLEHIRTSVDLHDMDSIAASAPALRALSNDRNLIVQKLNERIELLFAGESSAQLLLGGGENFYIRANIWPAMAEMANSRTYQDQFAYNFAHDHNFTFMTVNYLGPGYTTEIYEYDYEKVEGYIGENVELEFLEKVTFGPGVVMLYRAGRDVHIQFPPQELTITLNLMISLPEVRIRDQYCFDVAKKTITAYPNVLLTAARASLVKVAGYVGDSNTVQLLSDLASSHPCRRTRLTAFEALGRQQPNEVARIWNQACSDPSDLVSNTARRKLRELDSAIQPSPGSSR